MVVSKLDIVHNEELHSKFEMLLRLHEQYFKSLGFKYRVYFFKFILGLVVGTIQYPAKIGENNKILCQMREPKDFDAFARRMKSDRNTVIEFVKKTEKVLEELPKLQEEIYVWRYLGLPKVPQVGEMLYNCLSFSATILMTFSIAYHTYFFRLHKIDKLFKFKFKSFFEPLEKANINCCMLRIKLPSNFPAFYMQPILPWHKNKQYNLPGGEMQFELLLHACTYKVISVEEGWQPDPEILKKEWKMFVNGLYISFQKIKPLAKAWEKVMFESYNEISKLKYNLITVEPVLLLKYSGVTNDGKLIYSQKKIADVKSRDYKTTLKILSLNLQYYKYRVKFKLGKKIADYVKKIDPDVVCFQEDIYEHELKIDGYSIVSLCKAQKMLDIPKFKLTMANKIYVKKDTIFMSSDATDISFDTTISKKIKPRCASMSIIEGISIANVHLTGGRFEDVLFRELTETKTKQIKKLIDKHNPDIILGDFNGPNKDFSSLDKHPKYKDLDDSDKELYREYLSNVHKYLDKTKYVPIYTEKSLGKVTSKYGGVVDWFYIKSSLMKKYNINAEVIEALHLTDHNGVLVTLTKK